MFPISYLRSRLVNSSEGYVPISKRETTNSTTMSLKPTPIGIRFPYRTPTRFPNLPLSLGSQSPPVRRRYQCRAQSREDPDSPGSQLEPLLEKTSVLVWISMSWSSCFDLAYAAEGTVKPSGGFLAPISNTLEVVLNTLQKGIQFLHIPYSYGFSIILLTIIVKILTLPFTKKQVESAMAMQSLKPRIDNIKLRYGEDKEKIQRETSILYDEAGVDPLAGCFPALATIPILWGLFRTLSNVANEGILDTEGFFWIPSLAGPTTILARRSGSGLAWLLPLVDGAPPVGWDEASKYLILPVLLVLVQYYSTSIISPVDPNGEGSKTTKYLIGFLPLLVGYFALNVPSGLTLYYFSNTVVTTGQQYWLRKLGGANVEVKDLGPVTKLGMGRRTGEVVLELPKESQESTMVEAASNGDERGENEDQMTSPDQMLTSDRYQEGAAMLIRTRSKRKKLNWTPPSKSKKKEPITENKEEHIA